MTWQKFGRIRPEIFRRVHALHGRKHTDASLALQIKTKVEEDTGTIDDGLSAIVHLNHRTSSGSGLTLE